MVGYIIGNMEWHQRAETRENPHLDGCIRELWLWHLGPYIGGVASAGLVRSREARQDG